MNQVLIERVTHQLELLPDDVIQRVLTFINTLKHHRIKGIPGIQLMKFAGTLRAEDGEQMLHTIEHDCRRIDLDEW